MQRSFRAASLFLAGLLVILWVHSALACSRVVGDCGDAGVVVGRNMDWPDPMPVDLWALPRGIKRDGMTGRNTLRWTASYGSVVAAGPGASDGMNEKGLAAEMLWLSEADYGARDETVPGFSAALWAQYYLDNFRTVGEAVAFTRGTAFQIVTGTMPGGVRATLHLSLADATGDSAIIEYIGGKAMIYHDRKYTVMTNSPPFDVQLAELTHYKGFGGEKLLPGSTEAADRFVRAAFYVSQLPKPKDTRECIAGMLSVMRNVAQPAGQASPGRPYASATRWRTVADLTKLVYFFESSTSPNIVWVRLGELNFKKGAPVKKLDLIKNPTA